MTTEVAKDEGIRRRVVRGALSNYVGKAIRLSTYFALTPLILHHLGTTNYGLWTLVSSVTGYGALLDYGIAGAVTKFTAQYAATGENEKIEALVATTLRLYTALGFLALLLSLGIAPLFPVLFNVPPADHAMAFGLVLLMGLTVGISLPGAAGWALLEGFQRYDVFNALATFYTLLSAVVTIIALLLGKGIFGMVVVNIPAILVTQLLLIWSVHRIAPDLHIRWRKVDRSLIRTIFSFSSSLFVIQVAAQLETKTDEIVIGAFLPLRFITPYTIARKLGELPALISEQALKIFMPLASQLHAENDRGRLRSAYLAGSRLTMATSLPLVATLVILGPSILTVWVGAQYAGSAHLLIILSIAGLISTSQWPALSILQGMARHRRAAAMLIGSALTNLSLSIVLVHLWGVTGVALGTLVPTTIVSLGFIWPYALRELDLRLPESLRKVYMPTLLPALPMAMVLYVFREAIQPTSLPSLALVVAIGLFVYASGYLSIGASTEERKVYRSAMSSTMRFAGARFKRL